MEPTKELEKAIESKFLTPQKFAIEIEKIVAEDELNYIENHVMRNKLILFSKKHSTFLKNPDL